MDRPEDVERDPVTGAIYLSLTNNAKRGNPYGSILKIEEHRNDPLSLTFEASRFMAGGPESGFACPDNLLFDRKGNLWMCNDVSGSSIGKAPYESFGNNGLFYIPMNGKNAGRAFRVASAPIAAELTGLSFSPDQRTIFLSVQHPGETTTDTSAPTSRWPDGENSLPKSSVVTISGPLLDALIPEERVSPSTASLSPS